MVAPKVGRSAPIEACARVLAERVHDLDVTADKHIDALERLRS